MQVKDLHNECNLTETNSEKESMMVDSENEMGVYSKESVVDSENDGQESCISSTTGSAANLTVEGFVGGNIPEMDDVCIFLKILYLLILFIV